MKRWKSDGEAIESEVTLQKKMNIRKSFDTMQKP
jgi:hypothetical protein